MLHNQFDTIYHEHFSYLSLLNLIKVFESQGLEIFDVRLDSQERINKKNSGNVVFLRK